MSWVIQYQFIVFYFHRTHKFKFFDVFEEEDSDTNILNTDHHNSDWLIRFCGIISNFYKTYNVNYLTIFNEGIDELNNESVDTNKKTDTDKNSLSLFGEIVIIFIFSLVTTLSITYFGGLEPVMDLEPRIVHLNMFRYHRVLKLGCAKMLAENIPMPVIKEDIVGEVVEEFFESR